MKYEVFFVILFFLQSSDVKRASKVQLIFLSSYKVEEKMLTHAPMSVCEATMNVSRWLNCRPNGVIG